ncbi:unnamed protein product [Vicia faba]|uniref:Uncharacterized protein n=1 Tax=Vicia faba TaxID=3906 RepID=A0AAV0Z7S8_VICFA|nr:unnamed protein product [Vicia faba]
MRCFFMLDLVMVRQSFDLVLNKVSMQICTKLLELFLSLEIFHRKYLSVGSGITEKKMGEIDSKLSVGSGIPEKKMGETDSKLSVGSGIPKKKMDEVNRELSVGFSITERK